MALFLGNSEDVPSPVITNKMSKMHCSSQSLIFLCHGKDAYSHRTLRPRFTRDFWKYEKYERVLKSLEITRSKSETKEKQTNQRQEVLKDSVKEIKMTRRNIFASHDKI